MMSTSKIPPTGTPDDDKRRALAHAASRTRRRADAERAEANAFAFAHELGASLREIEEATGVPHMTVKRRIASVTVEADDPDDPAPT
jgi:hypothetical protein